MERLTSGGKIGGDDDKLEVMQLKHFILPFAWLGIGLIVSLLVLVIEVLAKLTYK